MVTLHLRKQRRNFREPNDLEQKCSCRWLKVGKIDLSVKKINATFLHSKTAVDVKWLTDRFISLKNIMKMSENRLGNLPPVCKDLYSYNFIVIVYWHFFLIILQL